MADATKTQRLLAAKKLVKEYQKSRKSKNQENKTPADSLTNSTHSSINEAFHIEDNQINSQSVSPLQQYFGGGTVVQPSINFFDTVKPDGQEFYSYDHINYSPRIENNQMEDTVNFARTRGNQEYEEDAVTIEDPDITPNEIFNRLNNNLAQLHTPVSEQDAKHLSEYLGGELQNTTNTHKVEENMESLKQLSTQIIQLIEDNGVPDNILRSNSELETKYKENLNYLEEEKHKNAKLSEEIRLYQEKVIHLENKFHQKQSHNQNLEMEQLLQEMESHEQTVKYLVAEKTDLEKAIAQRESELIQRKSECSELNARLKTSRSRVADLERELNNSRENKLKNNINLEENEKYINLNNNYLNLKRQKDEMGQDISELQQKLNGSTTENLKLQNEVQELTSKLSLLNIKLQQVSTGADPQMNYHVENLIQQIEMYKKQVMELNNIISILNNDKEQASLQYQQYVQQLNGQLNNLAQKLEEKVQENETLVTRECQLTHQMGELEKLLQKLQSEHTLPLTNNNRQSNQGKELEELREALKSIHVEKNLLEEKYQFIISERDEAFKDLELKKDELMQLEDMVTHLRSYQPNNAKLLAEMESNKVAAQRAVTQNEDLKSQLAEMQNVFIKISNEKLDLTEQLSNEKHKSRDLQDQLGHLESQIHTLTDAIAIKDKEMYVLRESASELNRYMVQQNQLEDRLRHYEAHDHSTHALQHELQQSYQRIQTLTTENDSLNLNMNIAKNKLEKLQLQNASVDGSQDSIAVEETAVLLEKVSTLERVNAELEMKFAILNSGVVDKTPQNINPENDVGDNENKLSQEYAMKQLQEKFTKMMKEIAELEDEKQRLEHLVMQLQDETETIGEYVTLYQHQRGVLKQRTLEKEEEMRQLTIDRQHMKDKIDQLNELVKHLMVERGEIAIEALEHQSVDKNQLCSEHAKVHQELSTNTEEFNNNSKTAEKIIELLSEIKSSSLVQPLNMSETFHPCPWCSGQLITV